MIAIDVLCLIIALLAAHALRFGFLPDTDYMTGMLVAVIAWPVPFFALEADSSTIARPQLPARQGSRAVDKSEPCRRKVVV